MKSRILLAILVGISLVLAVIIYAHQADHAKLEQSLIELENLPKTERDRFHSNTVEFYQHLSSAAHKERKRLRSLFYQIRNDPESENLTKTMEQYVDWVSRFSDPATMREIQSKSVDARVEAVHLAVLEEQRQINTMEPPITMERLKETIRESLPPELQTVDLKSLSDAFDNWLTQKYDDAKVSLAEDTKAVLTEEQLKNHLSVLEAFYRNLFRQAGMETSSSSETLGIYEKLTMLQLIQNLSPRQGSGGGAGFPRFGGGSRMGGFAIRSGGGPPFWGGGLWDDLLDQLVQDLLEKIDGSARQTLDGMNRPVRTDTLQRMLALALLEQYPIIDPGRFFQAYFRTEQQEWIKILGVYLSLMSSQRREEFLKQDSRSTLNRLQGELWFNTSVYFGLFRPRMPDIRPPDRPPGIGQPPPPPGMGQPPRGGIPRNADN